MNRVTLWLSALLLMLAQYHSAAAAPATQPAGSESRTLLVLPFTPPPDGLDWIGKAVQRDLSAGLASNVRGRVIAPSAATPPADADAALKAARDLGASVVVMGQVQAVHEQVRLSGQVLDVASGKPYGSLKATGTVENLFQLEDALAAQVSSELPRIMLTLKGVAAIVPGLPYRVYGSRTGELPAAELPAGELSDGAFLRPLYSPPPTFAAPETSPPPYYSPYIGSYPYSFYYPYAPLFTYGAAPDWFFIVLGSGRHHHFDQDDFRGGRDRFAQPAAARSPMANFHGGGGAPMRGSHGQGRGR